MSKRVGYNLGMATTTSNTSNTETTMTHAIKSITLTPEASALWEDGGPDGEEYRNEIRTAYPHGIEVYSHDGITLDARDDQGEVSATERTCPDCGAGEDLVEWHGEGHGNETYTCSSCGDRDDEQTAETVSRALGDDGQNYTTTGSVNLHDLCRAHGATVENGGSDGQSTRYEFEDGSVIVDCGGNGWDIEGATKWQWASA